MYIRQQMTKLPLEQGSKAGRKCFAFLPPPFRPFSQLLPIHLTPIQISQFPSGKNVLSDAAARPQKCILLFWLHSGKGECRVQQLLLIEGPLISHFHLKGAMEEGGKETIPL